MAGLPETSSASGEVLSDAWDYKGRHAVRSRTGGWASAAMILGLHPISIFALNPLQASLPSSFVHAWRLNHLVATVCSGGTEREVDDAGDRAANAVTNFMGVSFMLCLLGGFVADTYLGRYLTVGIFTAVQASVSSNTTTPCSVSGYISSSLTDLWNVFRGNRGLIRA
ncbi:hypothetical protein BHE74_00041736 [Ensete ventricosum]|nr:hypothetical protein BHE74_00041736 [Ensete ventricosum]